MSRTDVISLTDHLDESSRVTRYDRMVRGTCLLVATVCVVLAGFVLQPRINEERKVLELVVGENAFDDQPPGIALPTAMLSTFRGLMIHFLWTRAEELKSDSKYYELQQLYDWICNLQPRYPKVWENAAWNMAYNVSVGTFSSRERWHWVSAGLYLLRDKGIPFNPKTINLYKEASWIYLHKMGDFMDDHHWAYKRNWATIMERVLGEPPPEPQDEVIIASFREIAQAAKAIRKFARLGRAESLQLYIEHDTGELGMGDFVARLNALGYQPDERWLEAVARYSRRDLQLADLVLTESAEGVDPLADFKALMSNEKLASARDRLLAAVRAHVLAHDLKLDPEFMLTLMEDYGPLDWRTVYSHGLYWAALGTRECADTIGLDENVEMSTTRFIQFALKDTCERGRLVFEPDFDDPFVSFIDMLPDYRFAAPLHDLYLEQAEAIRGDEDPESYYREGPAGRLFKSGHVNFLHTAVRRLFLEGRIEQSRKYYEYLRENYKEASGKTKEMYLTTLEKFALLSYFEDIASFRQGPLLINTMLESALLNSVYGRAKESARRFTFAKKGYDLYMKDYVGDRTERRKLAPWPLVRASAFQDFLLRYPFPPQYKTVYMARAWKLMDNQVKLQIYASVEEELALRCRENDPPLDPFKAFPPPAGLEEYQAGKSADEKDKPDEIKNVQDVQVDEGSAR